MQKFAAYNEDGKITGFYCDVNSPVPAGKTAIPISDEEWENAFRKGGYRVHDGKLVAPIPETPEQALAKAQALQISILRNAEQTALTKGFQSNALGAVYTYPSSAQEIHQLNQAIDEATEKMPVNVWCQNPAGHWGYVPHALSRVQHVKRDWIRFKQAQQKKLMELIEQVRAAKTVEEVRAVVWSAEAS